MIIERSSDYFLFTDKSVAVVGNAKSLFDASFGQEIDSHDVVVRMNRAAMLFSNFDASNSHGTRTDVWCMWRHKEYENVDIHEPEYVAQMAWFEAGPEYGHVHVIENNMLLSETYPAYPSTGLMVLEWINRFKTSCVSVYGFDWKETPTFTQEDGVPDIGIHDFNKEKKMCLERFSHYNYRRL